MADPSPENIEGQKVVSHTFSHEMRHQVNWSHVALAAVVLVVLYVLFVRGGESADEENNAEAAVDAVADGGLG